MYCAQQVKLLSFIKLKNIIFLIILHVKKKDYDEFEELRNI